MGIFQKLFGFDPSVNAKQVTNNNVRELRAKAKLENAKADAADSTKEMVLSVMLPVSNKINADAKAYTQAIVWFVMNGLDMDSLRLYDTGLTKEEWGMKVATPITPAPGVKLRTYLQVLGGSRESKQLADALEKAKAFQREKARMIDLSKEGDDKIAKGQAALAVDLRRGINGEDPCEYDTRHTFVRVIVRCGLVRDTLKLKDPLTGVVKHQKVLFLRVKEFCTDVEVAHPRHLPVTEEWVDNALNASAAVQEEMSRVYDGDLNLPTGSTVRTAATDGVATGNSAAKANSDMDD